MKTQQQIDKEQSQHIKRLSFGMVFIGLVLFYLIATNHNDVNMDDFEEFQKQTHGLNKEAIKHALKVELEQDKKIHDWTNGLISRCSMFLKNNPDTTDTSCLDEIKLNGHRFKDPKYWKEAGYPIKD